MRVDGPRSTSVCDERRSAMNTVLTGVIVIVVALALVAAAVLAGRWLRRRMLDPPGVRSAAQALWTAGLAAPPLREGLTLAPSGKHCRTCWHLSLIHISEPTRRTPISYAVF